MWIISYTHINTNTAQTRPTNPLQRTKPITTFAIIIIIIIYKVLQTKKIVVTPFNSSRHKILSSWIIFTSLLVIYSSTHYIPSHGDRLSRRHHLIHCDLSEYMISHKDQEWNIYSIFYDKQEFSALVVTTAIWTATALREATPFKADIIIVFGTVLFPLLRYISTSWHDNTYKWRHSSTIHVTKHLVTSRLSIILHCMIWFVW